MMASYARHRNRSEPVLQGWASFTYTGSINRTDTYGPFDGPFVNESMDDVVTENYHKLVAQGAIINNSCVYAIEKRQKVGSGSCSVEYPAAGWTMTGEGDVTQHFAIKPTQWDVYCPLPDPVGDSQQDAKLHAVANIDSTPYAFGEDTLELRETLRFLRNPLKSVLDLTKTLRRSAKKGKTLNGRPVSIKDLADNLSDIWLQYRFAASPLVRSCIDALEAYQEVPTTLPERLSARGFSTAESSNYKEDVPQGGIYDPYIFFTLERSKKYDWHASILYEVSNPIRDWRYRLGFRGKDWPTTIWQIVPYSFMVDRVLDVTSFSKGVINLADPNLKILAASVTHRTDATSKWQLSYALDGGGVSRSVTGEQYVDTLFTYTRLPWTPSFADTIPRFTPGRLVDDATKITDLCALIYSGLTRSV